ncbi:cobalamin biosynthesis protein CbiX [Kitasatospora sp. NPDC092948]|uniref:cobalamin biosynthesis protein CbiX n=1 Tax=Kitasatospora sp. NPDC092948 TaxID=3364088 RepID=UPI0038027E03
MPDTGVHVLAVCGHESGNGAALRRLAGPDTIVVGGGRELYRALTARPSRQTVAVVPMTLGRDPELVADAARTVRALPPELRRGTAVAEPFGSSEHLVGWLRAAASGVPAEAALLITAPAGDPYQDAELHRVAHLVRVYGRHRLVETALLGGDVEPAEGVRRCALLGARQVAVLSASFLPPAPPAAPAGVSVRDTGPLLGPASLAAVLSARAGAAVRRLRESGEDGVGAALSAADRHGPSHSHGVDGGHHRHEHHHGPGEGHAHDREHHHEHHHGPGEGHTHGPGSPPVQQHIHSSPLMGARSHQ